MNQNDHKNALDCYIKAVELEPQNSIFLARKGNILYLMKKYNKAIKCFDQAIKVNPNYPVPYVYKGVFNLNIFILK